MSGVLAKEALSSPFDRRAIQPRIVSLEEAERSAVQIYYASLTKRTLFKAIVAIIFLAVMGFSAVNFRGIAMETEFRLGGALVLACCAAGLAFVIYEYRRKQRVFILEDSFGVERRFSFDVELIKWSDVAKLYCLDRVTETKYRIYFVPVATSREHKGKLRIVLVDRREIVLTNRVRDFSEMATQFSIRSAAAHLASCTALLIDGGTLDFDKFSLTGEGLVYKRKLLAWSDIQSISLDGYGTLLFKTASRWRSPRFNIDTLPNASLLLKLLGLFRGEPVIA